MRVKLGLALLFVLCVSSVASAQPAADARLESGLLTLQPRADFDRAILTVSGPGGLYQRLTFGPGETIAFSGGDTREGVLADGGYQYQLVLVQGQGAGGDESMTNPGVAHMASGSFSVIGGATYDSPPEAAGGGVVSDQVDSLAAETYFGDDLQVAGDIGVGHSNGQNPDKEIDIENLSEVFVRFDDTGGAVTTWDVGVPASSYRWIVSHVDASPTTPFTILDNTPDNTLYLNASGNVGIGTATPGDRLHILGSNDIRMEDNSGTIWDFGHGSSASGDFEFQLIDDGSGGSVGSVLTLEDDETATYVRGVGVFESNPQARLHVGSPSNDGTAKILVTEENATVTGRTMFEMKNNGNVQFFFENTDSGDIFQMSQLSTVFQISSPTGTGKFRVRKGAGLQALNGSTTILDLNSTGDLTVKSVTQTSSRVEKRGFHSVDAVSVLDKVAGLPISEWSYKADSPSVRHIGPMSEDFHAAFGLGKTDKGLTSVDTTGVALAAIQGLNQKLAEKDARINELEQRLLDLEEMVQALAEH